MAIKLFYIHVFLFFSNFLIGQSSQLKEEIVKIIQYETDINRNEFPCLSILVIDGDSSFYVEIFSDTPDTIKLNTPLEIGSISKVFTASLIHELVNHGIIQVTEVVNKYIPLEFRNPRLSTLTIGELINHYGGFPKLPRYFGTSQKSILDPYAHYTKGNLLKYYKEYIPQGNDKFEYSHVGYAILEIVIQEATDMLFEKALKKYLLSPNSWDDTFVTFGESQNLITGYNRANRKISPRYYPTFAAAEGLKSSMEDLGHFLNYSIEKYNKIKSQNNQIANIYPTSYNDQIYIQDGWNIVNQGNKPSIYTHSGSTSGYNAMVAMVPETKTGVVVFNNSARSTKNLGFLILRMINNNWKRKA